MVKGTKEGVFRGWRGYRWGYCQARNARGVRLYNVDSTTDSQRPPSRSRNRSTWLRSLRCLVDLHINDLSVLDFSFD